MANLIIPDRLKKGDTIAFISPSAGLAPFAMHRIERAASFFEAEGFIVKSAKNALKNAGYVSSSARERAADINEAFADQKVKCVMATIGGNHSNQVLPFIDWDIIKNNPKIFIGYSDITVLHQAILSQTGMQTYYGPCVMTQFGENPRVFDYTWDYFKRVLSAESAEEEISVRPSDFFCEETSLDWFKKEDLSRPRKTDKNNGWIWWRSGKAAGRIAGGCVPSINHLLGTKYWNDPKGSIFFIDIPEGASLDKGLAVSEADSYLADLANAGVFNSIAGLIVGRPYRYSLKETEKLKEIILGYTQGGDYPVLANANIGHVDPIITLPYGANALLDSAAGQLNFKCQS
ncbi:MAG TPA: LD-carboxypeptidase [Candidatus Paceibacterota bacterium]|nr:LD-carboxypeptidase [Candidatus Pacearchaeota archaeon]HRZ51515.1 LD-carboxypeptidase [Candidatus Paceibacterota bacterium]HSA37230.1 LD-carboxypeptidase [Candidatus Paceibacterota bacterium]